MRSQGIEPALPAREAHVLQLDQLSKTLKLGNCLRATKKDI